MNEEPVDIAALRTDISKAASVEDLAERALEIIAVLESVTAPMGIHPVVIGGMAVYFWTERDEFITHDVDVAMPISERLSTRLAELGFVRGPDGRHWRLKDTDILLEAPTSHLDSNAEFFEVKLRSGRRAKVLSRVDILVDRLDEFQATGHETPAQQALALLADLSSEDVIDLDRRAGSRGVTRVLEAMRRIAADIAAGGASPDSGELHEIARAALQGEYPSRKP